MAETVRAASLILGLLFLINGCSPTPSGIIGQELQASFTGNFGTVGDKIGPIKEGAVRVIVDRVTIYKATQNTSSLNVHGKFTNVGNFPLTMLSNTKVLIDTDGRHSVCDPTAQIMLNPGIGKSFIYSFTVPNEMILHELYLANFGPKDLNEPGKGFHTIWRIKLKEESKTMPAPGPKIALQW